MFINYPFDNTDRHTLVWDTNEERDAISKYREEIEELKKEIEKLKSKCSPQITTRISDDSCEFFVDDDYIGFLDISVTNDEIDVSELYEKFAVDLKEYLLNK